MYLRAIDKSNGEQLFMSLADAIRRINASEAYDKPVQDILKSHKGQEITLQTDFILYEFNLKN